MTAISSEAKKASETVKVPQLAAQYQKIGPAAIAAAIAAKKMKPVSSVGKAA